MSRTSRRYVDYREPDTTRSRPSVSRYLGNVIDETRDFLDDVLDRGYDFERGVRRSARRALDERASRPRQSRRAYRFEEDDHRRYELDDELRRRLGELRDELSRLSRRLDDISASQQDAPE